MGAQSDIQRGFRALRKSNNSGSRGLNYGTAQYYGNYLKTAQNHIKVLTNQWGHAGTGANSTYRAIISFQRFIYAYEQNGTTLSDASKRV